MPIYSDLAITSTALFVGGPPVEALSFGAFFNWQAAWLAGFSGRVTVSGQLVIFLMRPEVVGHAGSITYPIYFICFIIGRANLCQIAPRFGGDKRT